MTDKHDFTLPPYILSLPYSLRIPYLKFSPGVNRVGIKVPRYLTRLR